MSEPRYADCLVSNSELFDNSTPEGTRYRQNAELVQDLSSDFGPPGGYDNVGLVIGETKVWRRTLSRFNGFGGINMNWITLEFSPDEARELIQKSGKWTLVGQEK